MSCLWIDRSIDIVCRYSIVAGWIVGLGWVLGWLVRYQINTHPQKKITLSFHIDEKTNGSDSIIKINNTVHELISWIDELFFFLLLLLLLLLFVMQSFRSQLILLIAVSFAVLHLFHEISTLEPNHNTNIVNKEDSIPNDSRRRNANQNNDYNNNNNYKDCMTLEDKILPQNITHTPERPIPRVFHFFVPSKQCIPPEIVKNLQQWMSIPHHSVLIHDQTDITAHLTSKTNTSSTSNWEFLPKAFQCAMDHEAILDLARFVYL